MYAEVGVFLLALGAFSSSLNGDLVFDDVCAIVRNPDVTSPSVSWSHLWSNDFWGTPIKHESSHKSFRPLTVISFRLNHRLHGLTPWGYHVTNVLLHGLATLLYHRLCQYILPNPKSSFIASALFAVHPVHTDAVASVVGRAEILSAIFFVLTLLVYFKNSSSIFAPFLFTMLGTFCKEQCATVFLVLATIEILQGNKYRSVNYVGAFVTVLGLRATFTGTSLPNFSRWDNPAAWEPLHTRSLTYLHLACRHAWMLVCPSVLACDWSGDSVPLVTSPSDPRFIASVLLVASLAGLAFKGSPTGRLALAIALVPFLPASNLFFPVGFVLAERVLYLPSLGFSLLVAHGWTLMYKCLAKPALVMTGIVILVFFCRTFRRSLDWKNELSLFSADVATLPNNVKLTVNLGQALEHAGRPEDALTMYRRATSLRPDYSRGWLNVGRLLAERGHQTEAEDTLRQALSLVPQEGFVTESHLQVLTQLAALLRDNGRNNTQEAETLYRRALKLRPDYGDAILSLGDLLLHSGRVREAAELYRKALESSPAHLGLWNNLGVALRKQRQPSEALKAFFKALSLDPHNMVVLDNLAMLLQEISLPAEKEAIFRRMEEMLPNTEEVSLKLSRVALHLNSTEMAEMWLRKAIQANPSSRAGLYNLALLLAKYHPARSAQSFDLLTQLLQYHPGHLNGLLLLAEVSLDHSPDQAELWYRRALEISPDHPTARHNLCAVLAGRGQPCGALSLY